MTLPSQHELLPGWAMVLFVLLAAVGFRLTAGARWGRRVRLACYWLLMVCCVEWIFVAVLMRGENIWAGMGVAGVFGTVALVICGPRLRKGVEMSEARRMAARDCF
jgi:hypothetical protein